MIVLFTPEVRQYFRQLGDVLYEKEYFGFEEFAIEYVTELIFEIETKLHTSLKHKAPSYFERYGTNLLYSKFRKNRRTQWYVFFNVYKDGENEDKTIYLVRYISNNHVIAQYI